MNKLELCDHAICNNPKPFDLSEDDIQFVLRCGEARGLFEKIPESYDTSTNNWKYRLTDFGKSIFAKHGF